MRIAIFGAGQAGQFLLDEIRVRGGGTFHVDAFLDTYAGKETIGDISVYRPDDYLQEHKPDAVFLAAGAQKAIWKMIEKVRSHGIDEIYMLQDIAGKNRLPLFDATGNRLDYRLRKVRFSKERPTLPYFEMPIVDACNLNCRGCLFGCNRHGEQDYMRLEEIQRDMERMAELFEDIPWIRLLGGEPLLHPELGRVLDVVRRIFPDTELDVCTNGLALPGLSKSILDAFVRNKVTVHISGYRPTYKLLDAIRAVLEKNGLDYYVLKREVFYKFYTQEAVNDAEASFAACPSAGCRELYRGRLAKCSAVLAFERLNEQFGTDYIVTRNRDYFDIYDKNLTAWEIVRGLDAAAPICRYCDTEHAVKFPWQSGQPEVLEDYLLS